MIYKRFEHSFRHRLFMMTNLVFLAFVTYLSVCLSGITCQDDTHEADLDKIKEEILKVIDTVTNGQLGKAATEFDKKIIIAKTAVEGTSLKVSTVEEIQGISDFLRKGSSTGGVTVSPGDETKIKENIQALFEKSNNEDVKSVVKDSQCVVIGSLLKTPPDLSNLDMDDIVKKVKMSINKHTDGAYDKAADEKDKQKVVMDALLKGTDVAIVTEEGMNTFVEGLRGTKLAGVSGITAAQETKIKQNMGHIFKGDSILELLTDESRYTVMALVLAGEEVIVLDTDNILKKIMGLLDTKSGGGIKAAATEDEKKAVTAKMLSEGTSKPLDADTIIKILTCPEGERVEGVSPEDVEKVRNNTKELYDCEGTDDELKSIVPESRVTLTGHLLQNLLKTKS